VCGKSLALGCFNCLRAKERERISFGVRIPIEIANQGVLLTWLEWTTRQISLAWDSLAPVSGC
jgi:hypothetical protein